MRSFESMKREAKLREAIFNDKNKCKAKIYQFEKPSGYCLSAQNLFLHLDLQTGGVESEVIPSTCDTRIVDSKTKTKIITSMKPFTDNSYVEENKFELMIHKSTKNPKITILANYTEDVAPEKTIHTHFNASCSSSQNLEWLLVIYPNYVSIPIIFGFDSDFRIKNHKGINYTTLFDESSENSDYSFTSFYNEFSVSKTETISTNIPSIKLDTKFVKANNCLSAIDINLIPESNNDKYFKYEDEYFVSTLNCDGSSMKHYLKGDSRLLNYYDSSMIPFSDSRIFDISGEDENLDIKVEFKKYLYALEDSVNKDYLNKYKYYPAKYNISNHYRSYIVKGLGTTLFRIDIFGDYEYIRYTIKVDNIVHIYLYKVETIDNNISLYPLILSYSEVMTGSSGYLSYLVNKKYKSDNDNFWKVSRTNNMVNIENHGIRTHINILDKNITYTNNILSRDVDHTIFLNELGLPININYIDKPNSEEE